MEAFNTMDEIIEKFDDFYEQFKKRYPDNDYNFPKKLTMLFVKNCDYCKKTNCINETDGTNVVNLQYNYGIQLCDNCFNDNSESYYRYMMEIISKNISLEHFKNIIMLFNPLIDFKDIWVRRSNGVNEKWKIDIYSMISFEPSKDTFHISVMTKDETITKTNELKVFCSINDVNYDQCLNMLKRLYYRDNFKIV